MFDASLPILRDPSGRPGRCFLNPSLQAVVYVQRIEETLKLSAISDRLMVINCAVYCKLLYIQLLEDIKKKSDSFLNRASRPRD